jgi:hypothetical protein
MRRAIKRKLRFLRPLPPVVGDYITGRNRRQVIVNKTVMRPTRFSIVMDMLSVL